MDWKEETRYIWCWHCEEGDRLSPTLVILAGMFISNTSLDVRVHGRKYDTTAGAPSGNGNVLGMR